MEHFQRRGEHFPTHSHTPTHTDPLSGRLQSVMSCLAAGCKNHNKQCLWPADHSWRGWRSRGSAVRRPDQKPIKLQWHVLNCSAQSLRSPFLVSLNLLPNFTTGVIKVLSFSHESCLALVPLYIQEPASFSTPVNPLMWSPPPST